LAGLPRRPPPDSWGCPETETEARERGLKEVNESRNAARPPPQARPAPQTESAQPRRAPAAGNQPPAQQIASEGSIREPEDRGREWMLAFQAGSEAAFDRIVLDHRGLVRRFIERYVQDRDRVEDLEQEAFLRVYRARNRYKPEAGFKTWLCTIVVRLCLNEIRTKKRERRVIVPMPALKETYRGNLDASPQEFLDGVAERGVESPEQASYRKELEEAVAAAIGTLPPAQRAAILLLKQEDHSYEEIAQALGVSVMAVKSLIHRGREALRVRLRPFLGESQRQRE